MGRSFANLHIKSENIEKTIKALKELSGSHTNVLGQSSIQDQVVSDGKDRAGDDLNNQTSKNEPEEINVVMYVGKSNENWVSVLHDYFVWGTVKKIGKALSQLIEEPVMTVGYINEEIFELSIYVKGDIQAERIFCEEGTRDEYGLQEERLQDDYLREVLDIGTEDFDHLIGITSPWQAADKLSELVGITIWSDAEWLSHDENLRNQFGKHEFHFENT